MDAKALLDKFLNSGMATGALAGGAAAILLGRSGLGRDALKLGGLALVGTLAYQAWQKSKQTNAQLPPEQQKPGLGDAVSGMWKGEPGSTGALQGALGGILSQIPGVGDMMQSGQAQQQQSAAGFGSAEGGEQLGLAVITAMVMAAKADGHIDANESQKIFQHMDQARLDGEERAFVMNLLSKPADIDALARMGTTPEISAQIYTASALVLAEMNEAERAYLDQLAHKLRLDPNFVRELSAQMQAIRTA